MTARSGAVLVLIVAGLVVLPGTASALAGSTAAGGTTESAEAVDSTGQLAPEILQSQSGFDQTTFIITVYENGSARWTFQYTRTLENESDREDFRTYADDFNENETDLYRNFRDRGTRLTDEGSDVTGRSMDATGFSKRAYIGGIQDNLGVVEMSFVWTGFAATDDGVVVGDVFQGGLYLGPDQTLRFHRGPELEFGSGVSPEPDSMTGETLDNSDSVSWNGEIQFADQRPRVPFHQRGEGPQGPDDDPFGRFGMLPLVVVVVVLLGGGAAVAWHSGVLDSGGGSTTPATGGGGASGAGGEGVASEPAVSDEELLSDEDRVVQLLEESGGRMKQVDIVDETGWSKSKVSMLLSEMEDQETISKLRVGRENVISLSGHEPEAAKSPFDDDGE